MSNANICEGSVAVEKLKNTAPGQYDLRFVPQLRTLMPLTEQTSCVQLNLPSGTVVVKPDPSWS